MSKQTDKIVDKMRENLDHTLAGFEQVLPLLTKAGFRLLPEAEWQALVAERDQLVLERDQLKSQLSQIVLEQKKLVASDAKQEHKKRQDAVLSQLQPLVHGRLCEHLVEMFVKQPEAIWDTLVIREILKKQAFLTRNRVSSRATLTQTVQLMAKKDILTLVRKGSGPIPSRYQLNARYRQLLMLD